MRSSRGPLSLRRVPGEVTLRAPAAFAAGHPTRAGVGRRDELKARGEQHGALATNDRDDAVLQRLAQRLERRATELRQLVEEQHAVMGEARLAGGGNRPAAD
jgi:hypothetical protein